MLTIAHCHPSKLALTKPVKSFAASSCMFTTAFELKPPTNDSGVSSFLRCLLFASQPSSTYAYGPTFSHATTSRRIARAHRLSTIHPFTTSDPLSTPPMMFFRHPSPPPLLDLASDTPP
jgi:hypothetical protein